MLFIVKPRQINLTYMPKESIFMQKKLNIYFVTYLTNTMFQLNYGEVVIQPAEYLCIIVCTNFCIFLW